MMRKLNPLGLDWANFHVLRRTQTSLGHEAGVDPKVAAGQRGHGVGAALEVDTKVSLIRRAEAAEVLEDSAPNQRIAPGRPEVTPSSFAIFGELENFCNYRRPPRASASASEWASGPWP